MLICHKLNKIDRMWVEMLAIALRGSGMRQLNEMYFNANKVFTLSMSSRFNVNNQSGHLQVLQSSTNLLPAIVDLAMLTRR